MGRSLRNPLELIRGMQRPSDSALRLCSVNLSPFTFHQSRCKMEPHPTAFPYSLAADNFSTSSFVSFTSTERNKGGSCSGVRALAIGATTVG
jgi:hypothetical protein